MNKAYKFRLYPNKEQEIYFAKTFGCVRFIYNKTLVERKELYEKYKDGKEELKKAKSPTPAKYKAEFIWLKEVDSLALCNAQLNLQIAYNNFFRDKKVGFPKFKCKHRNKDSYSTNNQGGNIRIENNKIKLPKIGFVKLRQHREIPENQVIKSCTITKIPTGKYYISIMVEYEHSVKEIRPDPDKFLGLDMDIKNLYTDSQSIKAEYPRFYRKSQAKLAKEQRKMSKCILKSKNRDKQRERVNRLHEKTTNQRKDFLHQLSRRLTDNYDAIVIEDLNMKAMSQCLKLGKSVHDNGWGIFTTFLKYKLADQGKHLVKIDKWFPSSKTCSNCGYIKKDLELKDRQWECINCGIFYDRDYNAAINIRDEGIRMLCNTSTGGTSGIACLCSQQ